MNNTENNKLHTISNIRFTCRELDILACLLHNRKEKKIAEILAISPRTVETHIANIKMKLAGCSKEQIIDFLEVSNKVPDLKNTYSKLLIQKLFLQALKETKYLLKFKKYNCAIINQTEDKNQQLLIEKSLEDAGIIISETNNSIVDIYMQEKEVNLYPATSKKVIYIAFKIETLPEQSTTLKYINFTNDVDYELNILNLLLQITENPKIPQIINDFIRESTNIRDGSFYSYIPHEDETKPALKKRKAILLGVFILLILSLCSILIYNVIYPRSVTAITSSDEVMLHDDFYLERTAILRKMDSLLSVPGSINTIALVGIGGSGKTTLAQQYANIQDSSIVWKINAETSETTMISLECLAYALCSNDIDKADFYEIQKLTNPLKKEYMLFSFLKSKASKYKDWILIYDNVTNFSDIQKYLPYTVKVWGEGKVIITTTNSNITDSNYFTYDKVVHIPQLSSTESLKLFNTILGTNQVNSAKNQQKTIQFLKNIPPFPLDIKQAAYYIKNTGIGYDKYLQYIKNEDQDFTHTQESILGTFFTNHTQTRRHIIGLSLKNIIDSHEHLNKLLLLCSLLNSKNIPKDILVAYKGDIATHNFITEMRKFSLINEDDKNTENVFSIHDSIQSIIFNYVHKMYKIENYDHIVPYVESFMEQKLVTNENLKEMQYLSNHLESLLEHEHLFSTEAVFSIRNILGDYYYEVFSDKVKAKSFLEHARMVALQQDKSPRVNLAKNSTYLAKIYSELGHLQEAKKLLQESITFFNNQHDESYDRYKAEALLCLGINYQRTGKFLKAERMLLESLEMHKKIYGLEHPLTTLISTKLAETKNLKTK